MEVDAAIQDERAVNLISTQVHGPFLPAPWHADVWDDDWPRRAPRKAWNMSAEARSKHASNIPSQRLLSVDAERVIDAIWRNRWRALLAVDDLVVALVDAVAKQDLLAETYFCFTSDHGFRLGQHNIMIGKRHPHDVDTRIPLVVRGPGIRPGSTIDALVTCLLYTSPSPRDGLLSRMPSSA